MEQINERLFFEHIARTIQALTKAYEQALSEVKTEEKATASIVDYTVLLNRLDRAIDAFKTEMRACLKDYIYLKSKGILNEQNAARYLQSQLDTLYDTRNEVLKYIPESQMKLHLGHNYYFHCNLKRLNTEAILEYFEMNYTLSLKTEVNPK